MTKPSLLQSFAQNAKQCALRMLPEAILAAPKKRHYRKVVAEFLESEEPDLHIVKKLVDAGSSVFDVGANIGVYTRFLSQYVGVNGSVDSFEPIPPTFSYLESNVRALGFANVRAHLLALSDCPGVETMAVPTYSGGGNNFYQASLLGSSEGENVLEFKVRVETLDNIWHQTEKPISFIKIDVEGAELSCIHGARECLQAHHPALLIEISGNMADSASRAGELKDVLGELGYRPYFLQGTSLEPWAPGANSVNYFFLTSQQLKSISS